MLLLEQTGMSVLLLNQERFQRGQLKQNTSDPHAGFSACFVILLLYVTLCIRLDVKESPLLSCSVACLSLETALQAHHNTGTTLFDFQN